jgi:hypothetical protein
MRNRSTRDTGRKASRVGATARVRAAKQDFLVVLHLKVICDPVAALAFAEEHFVVWVLEVEMLHSSSLAWRTSSVTRFTVQKTHEGRSLFPFENLQATTSPQAATGSRIFSSTDSRIASFFLRISRNW